MKKKSINLRGIEEILSEHELKKVLGGSGYYGFPECCHCNFYVTFLDPEYGPTSFSGAGGFCGSTGCSGYDCCIEAAESWMMLYSQHFGPVYAKSWYCTPNF